MNHPKNNLKDNFIGDNDSVYTKIAQRGSDYYYRVQLPCQFCSDQYIIFGEQHLKQFDGNFPYTFNFTFTRKHIADNFWESYNL